MISYSGISCMLQQMVWKAIWLDEHGLARRSNLVIIECDLNAKKHGYSAQSYIKALTKGLLSHWKRSQLFMQDGAGIHHMYVVQSFFKLNHITTLDWPPYSPNLNPIEHLWWVLKKHMYKLYLQYNNWSKAAEKWKGFCEALKECWCSIPAKLIKQLILSMPQCLEACRHVHGWQTKY
jgi:transposase